MTQILCNYESNPLVTLVGLGIPPRPEDDPVDELHKAQEAEAQTQTHQTSDLRI